MSVMQKKVESGIRIGVLCGCLLPLVGCSSQVATQGDCAELAPGVSDPAEGLNRKVFGFNKMVDDYALAPVARGYARLPEPVRDGVHNFAANFAEPKVLVNDLLQGNGHRAMNTLGRFTFNTLLGVGGLFDTAGRMGLPHHEADFGQTFGVWGIGNGPTVEWPLLGSANSRDSVGRVANFMVSPFGSGNSDTVDAIDTAQSVGDTVDQRAAALPLTDQLEQQPDYYAALRDNIAERRAQLVAEGRAGQVDSSRLWLGCAAAQE